MRKLFGRKPRGHDPRIPQMKNVRAGTTPTILPNAISYVAGMPQDLGAMLNNQLGDCTCAAVGHALQVWSFNAHGGAILTPPDNAILELYEAVGGYVPGNPSTDNGAVEQDVLNYWLSNTVDGNELAAFIEVDVTDIEDVKRTIFECGLIYIGFNVPASLNMTSGATWDYNVNSDNDIVGGHAVDLVGWTPAGNFIVISWGIRYEMTPAFWYNFVDEAYALANREWIEATGKSPAGLTIAELELLMDSMLPPAPPPGTVSQRRMHRHHRRIKRGFNQ